MSLPRQQSRLMSANGKHLCKKCNTSQIESGILSLKPNWVKSHRCLDTCILDYIQMQRLSAAAAPAPAAVLARLDKT